MGLSSQSPSCYYVNSNSAIQPKGGNSILGTGAVAAAALFGIYADLAMNVASATNSSPQTTELFAGDRADTLWKWVKIGGITAIGFGVVGSVLTGSLWPMVGVIAVVGVMFAMYRNALISGQKAKDSGDSDNSSSNITYLYNQS